MLPSFADETVEIIRPTWVIERGSKKPDYNQPESTFLISGCLVDRQQHAHKDRLGRQEIEIRLVLFAPPNSDIRTYDRIKHGGIVYDISGAPHNQKSPTGLVSHTTVDLVVWEG
jgi:hypothetical protein